MTHQGKFKGCLNRHDDYRSTGDMTCAEIRGAFRETVENRIPFYGEYILKDEDGDWVLNEKYRDATAVAAEGDD